MITTEEIAVVAYQMLTESQDIQDVLDDGYVDYERTDYTVDGIIVIPHTIDGEASVRNGQVNVNIHVPDIVAKKGKNPAYRINYPRLIELKKAVIKVLKSHYQTDEGWDWTIGLINPPIKEPDKNEHFVSLALEITVREKKSNIINN